MSGEKLYYCWPLVLVAGPIGIHWTLTHTIWASLRFGDLPTSWKHTREKEKKATTLLFLLWLPSPDRQVKLAKKTDFLHSLFVSLRHAAHSYSIMRVCMRARVRSRPRETVNSRSGGCLQALQAGGGGKSNITRQGSVYHSMAH